MPEDFRAVERVVGKMFRQRLPRRILYTYTIHSRIPLSKKKREIPSESVHVIRSSSHQDSNPACFRTWKPKMEVVPAQFCKDSSQNSLSWRISTICLYTSCVGSVVLRFCHTLVYMKGIERNVEIADFSVIVYFSALVQASLIHSGNCHLIVSAVLDETIPTGTLVTYLLKYLKRPRVVTWWNLRNSYSGRADAAMSRHALAIPRSLQLIFCTFNIAQVSRRSLRVLWLPHRVYSALTRQMFRGLFMGGNCSLYVGTFCCSVSLK